MDIKTRPGKKAHVLQLLLSLEVGGAERIVLNIMEKNNSPVFDYTACCLDSKGAYAKKLESIGQKVILLKRKPGIDWSMPFKLARLVCREKIDIIHAHGETPWFYAALASALFGGRVKCITTVHGWDRMNPAKRRLWKILSAFTFKVAAVSRKLFHVLNNSNYVSAKKLTIIINGIDISGIALHEKQSRRKWEIARDAKVIGTVSRIEPIKNHVLLLHAMKRLLQTGKKLKLVIVGDGPDGKEIRNLARKLNIRDNVIFTGERTDAIGFYSLFDVFVLPSLSEGISMTILEAMCQNIPVVASDIDGNREIIDNGINGFLFESEDEKDLVRVISYVLDNPGISRKAALRAYEYVKNRFSFERMIKEYEKIYRQAKGL